MISVIIPVYNAENYLHVCLNSVLKQTYTNLEAICIDDASTDNSLNILQFFAQKDARVKILKNDENKGSNFSKNRGLEIAQGEYISFLDANDWFSLDAFEILIEKMQNDKLDLAIFKNIAYKEDLHKFKIEKYYPMDILKRFHEEVFNHFDFKNKELFKIPANSYNKIYLKSFLEENKIKFNDEKLNHGDYPFFYNAITSAKRVSFINKFLYNKRITLKSMLNFDNKKLLDSIRNSKNILEVFLKNYHLYKHYKYEILTYIFQTINENYSKIENKLKKEFFTETQNFLKILIKDYWLYDDIKLIANDNFLDKFKFEEIFNNFKEKQPKISIILPVYNASEYLDRCLTSIINQTLNEIEIICINDGSKDNSLEILERYKHKDKRIRLYTQENKGAAITRNVGIQKVCGEYVLFVDSDDWIEKEMCEKLYAHAKNLESDLVLFNATENSLETGYRERIYFPGNTFNENYEEFSFDYNFRKKLVLNSYLVVWSKMYRLDLVKNLKFQEVPLFEDVKFHVETMLLANNISYLPELLYHYEKVNINSEQNAKSKTAIAVCIVEVFKKIYCLLLENNYFKEFDLNYFTFVLKESNNILNRINDEFKKNFFLMIKSFFNELKINFNLIKNIQIELHEFYYNIIQSENYLEFKNMQNY